MAEISLTLDIRYSIIKLTIKHILSMNVSDTETVTKINIEDISSHQTESVQITQRPDGEMIPERSNAIKIPLDNIVKK